MTYTRQVARVLDEEHRANLELLERLERTFSRSGDATLPRQAAQLVQYLEHDIERHFAFEEEQLFPRMADAGDDDLAQLLSEEHDSIREVARELLPLARAAAEGVQGAADSPALRRLGLEMIERQVAHIQKETMALLPLLEDLLDDEADRELAFAYACA